MPGPSSVTVMRILSLAGSIFISIVPATGENFIALVKRLSNTWPILGLSNEIIVVSSQLILK